LTGDIELHVSSEDWMSHGHHLNPIYGRVILHVVMWRDPAAITRLYDGQKVPVLVLREHVRAPACMWWPKADKAPASVCRPCRYGGKHLSEDAVARVLEEAGQARFLAKAAAFRDQLEQTEPGQALFEGVMTALGYSRNTAPFLELSRRLPLNILESLLFHLRDRRENESCAHIHRLLLSAAGLAPPQDSVELESLWAAGFPVEAMCADAWQLFRVRPRNSPVQRLAAISRLLVGFRDSGLLRGVVDFIKVVMPEDSAHLENPFLTAGIGRDRAGETIVNIVLPFAHAFGERSTDLPLMCRATTLYRNYGKLAMNCVEKHMIEQLGLSSRTVGSAPRQQGLLHIYRTLCAQGKCGACPLGQPETGDDVEVEAIGLTV